MVVLGGICGLLNGKKSSHLSCIVLNIVSSYVRTDHSAGFVLKLFLVV